MKKSPVPFSATGAFRPTAFTGRALIKGTAVVPGFEERRGYEVLRSKDKKERVHPNEYNINNNSWAVLRSPGGI